MQERSEKSTRKRKKKICTVVVFCICRGKPEHSLCLFHLSTHLPSMPRVGEEYRLAWALIPAGHRLSSTLGSQTMRTYVRRQPNDKLPSQKGGRDGRPMRQEKNHAHFPLFSLLEHSLNPNFGVTSWLNSFIVVILFFGGKRRVVSKKRLLCRGRH